MSNKIILNKRGQYYAQPSYSSVHPVLIIGIILFVLPFMFPIMNINPYSFINSGLTGLGLLCILIGGGLSIFKSSQ